MSFGRERFTEAVLPCRFLAVLARRLLPISQGNPVSRETA